MPATSAVVGKGGIRAGGCAGSEEPTTYFYVQGVRRSSFSAASRNNALLSGPVRPAAAPSRPVCRPVLLAPGPRSPRRPRTRLVTTNFKQSSEGAEEAPVARPRLVRHPLTEDLFAGAGPAETATQEVLFGAGSSAAVAAAPQPQGFLRSTTHAARHMAQLLTRPRALLRAVVRNAAAYGVPLLLAYFARQPLLSFWSFYCSSLDSYPLLTKIATGVVGTILGDFVAQKLSHQTEVQAAQLSGEPAPPFVFDVMRTSRLVIYGALVGTPVGHAWFQLLDTRIMPEAMTSAPAVLTKMTMDQLLMCPLATALFFVVMRCWEGHPNDAVAYMRGKMFPTLKANYVLWPLAHVINFAFVPPAQRILYCNAVGVVWTVILSTILNSKTPPKPSPEAAASGSRGPGPAADGGAGPDDSWGRSPAPGGAGGQAGWPRHVHAAFTPGLMAQATDISGSRCGPGREQPLKGYKRGMQPDVTYGRVLQCDTSSKDA